MEDQGEKQIKVTEGQRKQLFESNTFVRSLIMMAKQITNHIWNKKIFDRLDDKKKTLIDEVDYKYLMYHFKKEDSRLILFSAFYCPFGLLKKTRDSDARLEKLKKNINSI